MLLFKSDFLAPWALCFLLLNGCASSDRRDNVPATTKPQEDNGPSSASILDRVPDRRDQKMSQIFLTTVKSGGKTISTWCEGVSISNEPVVKRELTKTGLCFRRTCENSKCEELGNAQIPKKSAQKSTTNLAH